jgi:hypothetical protein
MLAPPLTSLHSYGLDFDRRMAIFELADGTQAEQPIPRSLIPENAGLRRVVSHPAENELLVTLPAGEEVALETLDPASSPQKAVRPVVYLDQLHWVTLAQSRWAPEKVTDAERAAAAEVIAMARDRLITLPLSAANMTETTQMDGRHRSHLATTMLGLSHGWQMRSPIAVRGEEIQAVLAGEDPVVHEAFSLEPGAVFAEGLAAPEAPADFPPEWQNWFQTVTSVNAMVAMMIDDERIENPEGRAMAAAWSRSHQELAIRMREQRMSKEKARRAALGRLIEDMRQEILAAAAARRLDGERLGAWLEQGLDEDLAAMPYLGRQHEVIYERLRNADDRWDGNDLNDINYLCCAAGYSDFVVAERKLCGYLNRVEGHVAGGAFVCRKLADLLEPLTAALEESSSGGAALSARTRPNGPR